MTDRFLRVAVVGPEESIRFEFDLPVNVGTMDVWSLLSSGANRSVTLTKYDGASFTYRLAPLEDEEDS